MATAEDLRNEMVTFMDKEGIKYDVLSEEDNVVRLAFAGRESKGGGFSTRVFVDFDEDGDEADSVRFVAERFATVSKENYPMVLLKLNQLNGRYRWIKFYMNDREDEGWLMADCDALLVPGAAALECVRTAFRMSDIVEDALIDLGDLVKADDEKERLRAVFEALKEMLGEE